MLQKPSLSACFKWNLCGCKACAEIVARFQLFPV